MTDLPEGLTRRDDVTPLHEHRMRRHVTVEGVDPFTGREDVPDDHVVAPSGAPLVDGAEPRALLVDPLSVLDYGKPELLPALDLDERVGFGDHDDAGGDRAYRCAAAPAREVDPVVGPMLLPSPYLEIGVRDVVAGGFALMALRVVELVSDRVDERAGDRDRGSIGGGRNRRGRREERGGQENHRRCDRRS